MKSIITITVLLSLILKSCIEDSKVAINQLNKDKIENFVIDKMKTHEIPGMAIAVVYNGEVIHKGFYGNKTIDHEDPITKETTFKIFSLTKTFVATSIFKLIQENKLSINDSLSKYFTDLPDDWAPITIANLLSHSSGLPDVRNYMSDFQDDSISDNHLLKTLFDEPMEFRANTQWRYNQTNYILLKLIIEKISKKSFEDHILQNQFPSSDPNDVFFSYKPFQKLPSRPNYYQFDKKENKYIQKPEFLGKKNLPLAGLNLTLDEYVKWNNRLDKNELLNMPIKSRMFSIFNFTESDRLFLHGWDIYPVNNNLSIGFSGGSVSAYRKFNDKDLSIIVLTTGYKYYPVQDMIIDHIASIVDNTLKDEKSQLIETILSRYFLNDLTANLRLTYENIKKENPHIDIEKVFKSVGYTLFFDLNMKEEAIALFLLNVEEFESSFDTHGSLGYLYFLTGQLDLSRKYYLNAQRLNPNNPYSKKKLEEIDAILKHN